MCRRGLSNLSGMSLPSGALSVVGRTSRTPVATPLVVTVVVVIVEEENGDMGPSFSPASLHVLCRPCETESILPPFGN